MRCRRLRNQKCSAWLVASKSNARTVISKSGENEFDNHIPQFVINWNLLVAFSRVVFHSTGIAICWRFVFYAFFQWKYHALSYHVLWFHILGRQTYEPLSSDFERLKGLVLMNAMANKSQNVWQTHTKTLLYLLWVLCSLHYAQLAIKRKSCINNMLFSCYKNVVFLLFIKIK